MNIQICLAIIIICCSASFLPGQETIKLYPGKIPGSKDAPAYQERTQIGGDKRRYINHVKEPTLTAYFPEKGKQNGVSVIICPGGGYQMLAIDHEGIELAKRFNEYGITAFILKYRLPNDSIMQDKTIGPLQDAQRAMQLVRERAAEWKLDPGRVGIIGASAGGHLAASAGTLYKKEVIDNPQHISLRPDYIILMYPVISFAALAHTSSAKRLLGEDLSQEKLNLYSCEKQVTKETAPTFLLHASNDKQVLPEHSILFYQALIRNDVPAEMHIYEKGGHGFGLHNTTTEDDWFLTLIHWMNTRGLISKS